MRLVVLDCLMFYLLYANLSFPKTNMMLVHSRASCPQAFEALQRAKGIMWICLQFAVGLLLKGACRHNVSGSISPVQTLGLGHWCDREP